MRDRGNVGDAAEYVEALNRGLIRERMREDEEVLELLGIEFASLLGAERDVDEPVETGPGVCRATMTIPPPSWKSELRGLRGRVADEYSELLPDLEFIDSPEKKSA
jgi:hypothetical protein